MHQFKYDVLPTERMQVIEVCRLDILISRALTKINEIKSRVDSMGREIELERQAGDLDDSDKMRIQQLDMNRIAAETAHVNYSKDYKELLDRRNGLFKEIKGTREQRIKRIEESKETIGTMLAALIDNPQMRRQLGIDLEKFRLATKIEYERLSEYHTYLDGKVEQPILNSENIKEDNV
jgi:recombinational DNA repair ATPase RecF